MIIVLKLFLITMNLKKINPITPSYRNLIQINNEHLNKTPLIIVIKNTAGRNNTVKITSYKKGGGHKQKYRKINFFRTQKSVGIVTSLEYDPNRTANIASIYDISTNNYLYIWAPIN